MKKLTHKDLLDAGVHFGHMSRKWNPKMSPYIFMETKGIHIIDLNKTLQHLEQTARQMRALAVAGKKIMFVATKKQAREVVKLCAQKINMPHVTERWYGGMLTNFSTIRKSIKKMDTYQKMQQDGSFESLTKKERLMMTRENEKLERILGGISNLNRLPAAIFVVDVIKEHIAVSEASKLNIPTFAIVDTNGNPELVDSVIPANDDAAKAIAIVVEYLTDAILEGLEERNKNKQVEEAKKEEEKAQKEKAQKEEAQAKVVDVEEAKVKEDAAAKDTSVKKATTKKTTAVKKVIGKKAITTKKTTTVKKTTALKKKIPVTKVVVEK